MSIFKKEENFDNSNYNFNKENIIKEITKIISNEFKSYKIIYPGAMDLWDLLIIRNVSRQTIKTLGLCEQTKNEIFQEIFAINVISKKENIDPEISQCCKGWTKKHFIVSNSNFIKYKLMEE